MIASFTLKILNHIQLISQKNMIISLKLALYTKYNENNHWSDTPQCLQHLQILFWVMLLSTQSFCFSPAINKNITLNLRMKSRYAWLEATLLTSVGSWAIVIWKNARIRLVIVVTNCRNYLSSRALDFTCIFSLQTALECSPTGTGVSH